MLIKSYCIKIDSKMKAICKILLIFAILFLPNLVGGIDQPKIILLSPLQISHDKNPILIWKCNEKNMLYFVYLGENKSNMKLIGITTKPFYEISLQQGKTYFWKVVAFNGNYFISSEIASFRVKEKKSWTYMLYLNGDNDLYRYAKDELDEIKNISNDEVSIVVLFDGNSSNDSRIYIKNGIEMEAMLNELNMGNGNTLEQFVKYVMQNYPSNYYMLEIWGHGNGWMGCCLDKTNNDILSLDEIKNALNDYKVDIILFAACYMGCVEVAYSLKNVADYMVACESAMPAGFPHNFLKNMKSPKKVCNQIIEDYKNYAIVSAFSAYNLNKIDGLVAKINEFVESANYSLDIRNATAFSLQYIDLYSFASNYKAKELMNAINETIISFCGQKGIGIYFPLPAYISKYYGNTDFALATNWDDFIASKM